MSTDLVHADVDVIVPVYRGLEETTQCIMSVLSTLPISVRLIVVNDASPEVELVTFCNALKGKNQVSVLTNLENLGFVESVNRAMNESTSRDVVLLNSDTEVNGEWLQRLQNTAYREDKIATVTPFSNNATICSYPVFCADNPFLPGLSLPVIDNIFCEENAKCYTELPTGVGFCMYIKRSCLNAIGLFDADSFGRGYGEENDFCLRAIKNEWKNVLAADVFVYHKGAVSFLEDKNALVENAESVINRLHPDFFTKVTQFIKGDSLLKYRHRVDAAILRGPYRAASSALSELRKKLHDFKNTEEELMNCSDIDKKLNELSGILQENKISSKPRLLFITHAWGGGVEQHIQDLLSLLGEHYSVHIIRGLGRGDVELDFPVINNKTEGGDRLRIQRGGFNTENIESWVGFFREFNFSRVHLHHVQGWDADIVQFISRLNIAYDITLHDYFALSSDYHLVNDDLTLDEQDNISAMLNAQGWPEKLYSWQKLFGQLLSNADRIIAPSHSVHEAIEKVFPNGSYEIMPHPQQVTLPPKVIKIVLLGALSPVKGLDLVEQVVKLAATNAPQLSFTLIGHSAEPIDAPMHVTGSYDNADLPRLIAEQRADILWLPSQVPETFCFTLTHALSTGLPIVASNIGALGERLTNVSKARLLPHTATAPQWIGALLNQVNSTLVKAEFFEDSFSSYYNFYTKPIKDRHLQIVANVPKFTAFIKNLPKPTLPIDTPINDLFRIGVYGGHKDSLVEVARRLAFLPDGEAGVAGRVEYNALVETLDTVKKDISFLTNALREADESFAALENTLAVVENAAEETTSLYQENLSQAENNIQKMQEQALTAQAHIHHMDTTAAWLTQDRDRLEGEREALVSSFSWRVTRPMRVAKRTLLKIRVTVKRLLRHAFRPASYARAFRLLRCGEWGVLLGRIEHESQAALEQEVACKSEPPTAVNNNLLEPSALNLEKFVLQTSTSPELSIVIPVYGQHETTYACLKSIADNPPSAPFEVIIMDDCSPEPAIDVLSIVNGATIIRNKENLGFVGNMNAGAKVAKGEWLILLNNDTVITGDAFNQLLKTFRQHENVGLVGAKLLNSNGTVQEAGGIIWRDGSGWNWGRGADRRDPRFNYVRDVDYCSGAVLVLRRELFMALNGFDTYYAPAYYEDTDLAFRIREKGLRVLYQPRAEIYHLEGVTHGRDESSGMKAYQVTNAKKFYKRWKQTLFCHAENAVQPENEAHRATKGNILIVEACMITPDQDSGSIRMLNLLQILKDEGHHITFVADNLEYREKPVQQMEAMGVEVLYGSWAGSVRQVLRKLGPSLQYIFFCRHYIASQYISITRTSAPKARLIFDTVDLHFVREERESELTNNADLTRESAITKRKELGVIAKSDITLVVSNFEKELLAKLMPNAVVDIVSNIHAITPERPAFSKREGIIFVGGFRHAPNVDAIIWYAEEVMPFVEKLLPGVVTTVIGSNMPEAVAKLQSQYLNIRGFVEDITDELTGARVSIAPLRYGAGVKGKVNEAMNYGIPVVSTICGVEGMHLIAGEEVLVSDNPQGFAEAIARVYNNKDLWQKLSSAGVENIHRHFSPEAALPALRRVLS